ncbi:MAG: AraC family transcriptional regulator [Flavisolibacter sp.]|nr:AraC family transcriptional regulator [Flavisolibacter sp.]
MPKDSAISTFDPHKLKAQLPWSGGAHFHASLTHAYEVFHINRIEDYNRMVRLPSEWDAQPFRLTVFSFFYLTAGRSTRSKGLNIYDIAENTFFFLPAYEISTYRLVNEGANGFFCHFNLELLTADYRLKDLLADFPFLNFNCHPLVTIPPEVGEVVLVILKRLEDEYKKGQQCRIDILRAYLIALFSELKPFATTGSPTSTNSAYQLTEQYKKALSQFIYEKQKVADYADMLAVTPNHLNKCVKTVTGQSAHDILSEMLLLEAKVLLNQTTLSISEIAYQIGRNDLSDFVRFFKSKTGMAPGEYRNMIHPEV